MKIFEVTNKKIKSGKYRYYECPKNVEIVFHLYTYKKESELLLFSAILQYISNRYQDKFKRVKVEINKNGDIFAFYGDNDNFNTIGKYNIDDFNFDDENNILYLIENQKDKLSLDRKLKLKKINKK